MVGEAKEKVIACTIADDNDGNIFAFTRWLEDDEKVVSDKYKTKFILCSARCMRKRHSGFLKDNIWVCGYAWKKSTNPFAMLGEYLEALEGLEALEDV